MQLTGRANYGEIGRRIGLDTRLLENPALANDPAIAARILAEFIKSKRRAAKYAILGEDLETARKLVNGGRHGLDRFTAAFETGVRLLG